MLDKYPWALNTTKLQRAYATSMLKEDKDILNIYRSLGGLVDETQVPRETLEKVEIIEEELEEVIPEVVKKSNKKGKNA